MRKSTLPSRLWMGTLSLCVAQVCYAQAPPLRVAVSGQPPRGATAKVVPTVTPTIVLTSSANPAIYGQPVTLTATVTPSTATGSITFYDGVNVLGDSGVQGGQATFTTSMLGSGVHSLKGYYSGDPADTASTSAQLPQTVNAVASAGFGMPLAYPGAFGGILATGDFNRDGKADLILASGSNEISLLLGNGDGTFHSAVDYAFGAEPGSAAVGDFDGDGLADFAVADYEGNSVSIFLGKRGRDISGALQHSGCQSGFHCCRRL
jgi:hypothetical protein